MVEEYVVVDAAANGSCIYIWGSTSIEVRFFESWDQMGLSPSYYYHESADKIFTWISKLWWILEGLGTFSKDGKSWISLDVTRPFGMQLSTHIRPTFYIMLSFGNVFSDVMWMISGINW